MILSGGHYVDLVLRDRVSVGDGRCFETWDSVW